MQMFLGTEETHAEKWTFELNIQVVWQGEIIVSLTFKSEDRAS